MRILGKSPKDKKVEFQNQIPSSNQPPIITGGPGRKPSWLHRLRELIWPSNASTGRKIATITIIVGIILCVVFIWLFITPTTKPQTSPDVTPPATEENQPQPDAPKPDTPPPAPEQKPPSSTPSTPAPSTPGGPSEGGGSTGGDPDPDDPPPSGGGSTSCPLPAYPKASCTGVPAGTSLTSLGSSYTTTHDNQVISNALVTGDVSIDHNNVTIRNSEIHGHIKNFTGGTFTVEDSVVGPPSGCLTDAAIGNNRYTATRVHLRGFAEGFRVEDAGDVTVRDSYVKFCNPGVDNHADAIQGYLGGSNVVFEHNTVDMLDIPKEADYVTAVIFWSDSSGNNVTFKNNLISGGSYSIRIHVGTGHTVTGNKVINNSWLYGPVSSSCSNINWSGNSIVEIDSNYNIINTVGQLDCAE